MTAKREQLPVLYADQPAQLALGPFVSRLTLGVVDEHSEDPVPVLSFSMPTIALLQMAKEIVQQIENPTFSKRVARTLAVTAERWASGEIQLDQPKIVVEAEPGKSAKTAPKRQGTPRRRLKATE